MVVDKKDLNEVKISFKGVKIKKWGDTREEHLQCMINNKPHWFIEGRSIAILLGKDVGLLCLDVDDIELFNKTQPYVFELVQKESFKVRKFTGWSNGFKLIFEFPNKLKNVQINRANKNQIQIEFLTKKCTIFGVNGNKSYYKLERPFIKPSILFNNDIFLSWFETIN
uniref:Uncharacterized protein n=1 Tax=Chlorokybus atmophyticus TaxID=3144 RepID=A2CI64_CHLAT|nr:hypothetical protein ChatCp092 [Chlorokybus atmophyticus]ABM87986.1 hypothetical protein [Chlorokybus atmophyticus]